MPTAFVKFLLSFMFFVILVPEVLRTFCIVIYSGYIVVKICFISERKMR